jgi:hypothetical protein
VYPVFRVFKKVFMENHQHIINLIKAAPAIEPPEDFTPRVMARLAAAPSLNLWQLLRQALAEAGEISWVSFTQECGQGRNAGFYFLIAGLFFFIIGSMLFSSVFLVGYATKALGFVLLKSILIIMAAISLVIAGLMMVTRVPDAAHWAKRAVMFYGILIIANAFLIQATEKSVSGGIFALTFGVTGILTGMVLMSALTGQTEDNDAALIRGSSNVHP